MLDDAGSLCAQDTTVPQLIWNILDWRNRQGIVCCFNNTQEEIDQLLEGVERVCKISVIVSLKYKMRS